MTSYIMSVNDFTADPGKALSDLGENASPTLLTQEGRGVAVVQTLESFEAGQEEKNFMRGVVQGLMDLENGREVSLQEARHRLRLT